MPRYQVGLTCSDSRVLPELSNRLKEPWSTIVEKEGTYYWSSARFDSLATVSEVDECATELLPVLNGLVKLHFMDAGELIKAGRIRFIDDQGKEITQAILTATFSGRGALIIRENENQQRETRQQWLNIAEQSIKEGKDSPISKALSYYGKEHKHNWQTLFNIYETIQREYNCSQCITNPRQFMLLPEEWTQDETGKSREKDFTESANNAYLSGYTARHSLEASHPIRIIPGSTHVKVIISSNKEVDIHPMTLEEAKIFIAHLLTCWLTQKFLQAASA